MKNLAKLIAHYRLIERRSLRELGAEIGVAAATLSRIEHGEMMDGATLAKVLAWVLKVEESEAQR